MATKHRVRAGGRQVAPNFEFARRPPAETSGLSPDLDTAEKCIQCQGWGMINYPRKGIAPCRKCQNTPPPERPSGLKPRRKCRGRLDCNSEIANQLKIEYEAGASVAELVTRHGRSSAAIYRLLSRASTRMRPS